MQSVCKHISSRGIVVPFMVRNRHVLLMYLIHEYICGHITYVYVYVSNSIRKMRYVPFIK